MTTVAPLQLQQQQLLLRLPDDLAARVHVLVTEGQQISKGKPATVIDVKPQDPNTPSDDFIFIVDNKEYPAMLLNLPNPLESHKTFDNKIFLKSSDIGQMLQVFNTDKDREAARLKVVKTLYGDYHCSGITPPTNDVVKRRFELTRKNETFLPYKIKQVCEEISQGVDSVSGGGLIFNEAPSAHANKKSVSNGDTTRRVLDEGAAASAAVLESVVEEVVDFEEWMADPTRPGHGVTVTVSGADWTTKDAQLLQLHPEMMLTQVEAEEDALEMLAVEQQLTEKERLATAVAMLNAGSLEQSNDTELRTEDRRDNVHIDSNESSKTKEDLRISVKLTATSLGTEPAVGWSSSQSPRSNADEDLQMTHDEDEENKDQPDDGEGEFLEEGEESEEEKVVDVTVVKPPPLQQQQQQQQHDNVTQSVVEKLISESDQHIVTHEESVLDDEDDDDDWMNSI